MIPIRLQLENFLSYGKGVPPLNFTGIRLACLSGDNGNGKSALLDAMTWALFGRTRATYEDNVIRLGASECRVFFDFEVGGQRYRVQRQRSRKGGGTWDLQIYQEDGTRRPLSGNNTSETRDKIRALLRMDYETFLSTCYLAQGQADVFARSSPNDRKKVLADILDLSRYDRLEAKAKDRWKSAADRESECDRALVQLDTQLQREDEFRQQLQDAEARRTDLVAEREQLQRDYEAALDRCTRLEEQAQKVAEMDERIREHEGILAGWRADQARRERRIAEAQAVAAQRTQIERDAAHAQSLQQRLRALNAQNAEAMTLQRERERLQLVIRDASDQLDRERYRLDRDVLEREKFAAERQRLDAEIERLDADMAGFGDIDAALTAAEDERAQIDERLQDLKVRHASEKAHDAALARRIEALEGSDASLCDYCGQPLSAAARAGALRDARRERDEIGAALESLAAEGREVRKLADTARARLDQIRRDQQSVQAIDVRRRHAQQERLRFAEAEKELPDLRRRRDSLSGRLDRGDFARPEQEELMKLSAKVERLERVGEEIQTLDTELARYAGIAHEQARLAQADQVLAEEPPLHEALAADIVKKESQVERARRQVEGTRAGLDALAALQRERTESQARLQGAETEILRAERLIGDLDGRLRHLAEARVERTRWETERQAAALDQERYRTLTAAFGKKGIQALLIDTALPEIQTATNELLHRMSGGALSVQLQTQREARTRGGAAIETLDIILSDDAGTRPFEMYSGGEAFRVSLALRVALSKTLARRAGAPLQTLILDEGFGTQDPRGREAIAEALEAIAEEFALVLVITHVEELKDRFPTRIEVIKGLEGSTFTVLE